MIVPKTKKEYKFAPSSGSTFSLACSDKAFNGFPLGRMVNIVGDSSSGKSFVALTELAEVARVKDYDDYSLIYDDVEAASSFDMDSLFGEKVKSRITMNKSSDTVEDFFYAILKLLNEGKPFIYVLDSLDALGTDKEIQKTEDTLEARAKGKNVSGDYGMQKPKMMSQLFRTIKKKIKQTDSMLIIVSQTRADINPRTFTTINRSGGKALEFYCSIVMWMALTGRIKKTISGIDYEIGVKSKIRITKNKCTGKRRDVSITIDPNYGIDVIGSSIEYLIKHGVFSMSGRKVVAKALDFEGLLPKLVNYIEDNNLEDKLAELVSMQWEKVELSLSSNRKRKF